ncbi:MAG: imelysin family protein [Myxococcota bacterium]
MARQQAPSSTCSRATAPSSGRRGADGRRHRGCRAQWLLFGPQADVAALSSRAAAYAASLATDLVAQGTTLVTVWEGEWAGRLTDPADWPDDPYDTAQDVIDEWTNRLLFTVEDVKAVRLGGPLGDGDGGLVPPGTLESPYAARSLADARDALAGVGDAFEGLRPLIPADRASAARDFDLVFAGATDALARIPEPLPDAVRVQPEVVVAAQDALRELQVTVQVEVAQALSVTVVFNDNDGD